MAPRKPNKWSDVRDAPAYTLAEAALYLRLPPATVRAWFRGQKGFQPVLEMADPRSGGLSFTNLVEAHVLAAIRRRHGVSLRKVRSAIEFVQEKLGVDRPLAKQEFATNGIDLFVEHLHELLNASQGGQRVLQAFHDRLQRIERDESGLPIKLYPLVRSSDADEQPRSVVIDPRVSFGRPVIAGTGIPTAVLAERFLAGESAEDLADDYGTTEEAIEDALRCEVRAA